MHDTHPKIETVKNHDYFKNYHIHPKVETIINDFFQEHHILPNIETG